MSLNIPKLIKKKRAAFPNDADYIEELERMLDVTNESYDNVEEENKILYKLKTTIDDNKPSILAALTLLENALNSDLDLSSITGGIDLSHLNSASIELLHSELSNKPVKVCEHCSANLNIKNSVIRAFYEEGSDKTLSLKGHYMQDGGNILPDGTFHVDDELDCEIDSEVHDDNDRCVKCNGDNA
jgi:hypothetical protein